ncbi:hypothetical protein [Shimia abyssi]|uniref:HEPN AbiU2-like domain-containing protein n=1 Tax=Shimia abyssi TaxID=1662395 RepID=A0A2P8FFH5_9RHOB|nr:hypothetical protein [Shimia abyssi]PSL20471.1 hypothetical protein CLV88_103114 [Shimia abyssi]
MGARRRDTSGTDQIQELLSEHWERFREERGRKEEELVYRRIRVAQKIVKRAERLLIKEHLRPFRDNFIAHNLAESARGGRKIKIFLGMEDRAIQHAKCAVDLLHLVLNGTSFAWDDLEKQQSRNALEFWSNLKYTHT